MKESYLFKLVAVLLFIFLFIAILYFARTFLIPVVFAALLAMLLLPLCRKLESWHLGRVTSIVGCLLVVLIILSGFVLLFYTQILSFTQDMDLVEEKLMGKMLLVQEFVEKKTGVPVEDQMQWLKERYSSMMESGGSFIKSLLMGFSEGLVTVGLIIIYLFFFLLYRQRFKDFLLMLFPVEHHFKVTEIINRTKDLILHYLTGLLIALTILGTMNAVGLLALEIRQALFLGYLAGFLNIIPYVGTLIGSLLPILVALLFKDSIWSAVGVTAIFIFNQFIDNNITTPNVVGSHVQVNPLATIMAVIVGGILWGIPGMILFIPMLGVFKIVCDNVTVLQPIGYLLGDENSPKESSFMQRFKRFSKKKKKEQGEK
jgi:predicted PurR-regulated permease PerM